MSKAPKNNNLNDQSAKASGSTKITRAKCGDCESTKHFCLTCSREVCLHHATTSAEPHKVIPAPPDLTIPSECPEHPQKKIEFYFPEFEVYGCKVCSLAEGLLQPVKISTSKCNKRDVDELSSKLTRWKQDAEKMKQEMAEETLAAAKKQILETFDTLHRELDSRKADLLEKLEDVRHAQNLKKADMVNQMNNRLFNHLYIKNKTLASQRGLAINQHQLAEMEDRLERDNAVNHQWKCKPFVFIDSASIQAALSNVDLSVTWLEDEPRCPKAKESKEEPESFRINEPLSSLILEPNEKVKVPALGSPSDFYIQKTRDLAKICEIKMKLLATKLKPVLQADLIKDAVVCVRGRRGRIRSIESDGVRLLMIDVGELLVVKSTELFQLPDAAKAEPALAYPCKLRYVEPNLEFCNEKVEGTWSKSATQCMTNFCFKRNLIIQSYKIVENCVEVELCVPPTLGYEHYMNTSLADILVTEELAVYKGDQPKRELRFPYQSLQYIAEKEYQVEVVHVEDPNSFFVRPKLDRLSKQAIIQEKLSLDDEMILVPFVNLPCYWITKENVKLRALITKVHRQKLVDVMLMENGHTYSHVKLSKLAKINQQNLKIPCLLRKVGLFDICPVETASWSSDAIEAFKSMLKVDCGFSVNQIRLFQDVEFRMAVETVSSGMEPLSVSLYEAYSDMDVSLNALMIYINIAKSINGIHNQVKFQKPIVKFEKLRSGKSVKSKEKWFHEDRLPWMPAKKERITPEMKQQPSPHQLFVKGTEIKCRITQICSPSRLFVIPEEFLTQELELQINITEKVKTEGVLLKEPVPAALCFARTSFGYFGRGRILQVKDDKKCEIYFLDSGSVEDCHIQDVFEFSDAFKDIPELVIGVHLSSIYPTGGKQWSVTAVEKTKEAVEKYCSSLTVQVVGPPVLVEVNEDAATRSFPVNLLYNNLNLINTTSGIEVYTECINISDKFLINKGLALKGSASSEDVYKKHISNLRPEHKKFYQPVQGLAQQSKPNVKKKTCLKPVHRLIQNFQWQEKNAPLTAEFKCTANNVDKDGFMYLQSVEEHAGTLKAINEGLTSRYRNSVSRQIDRHLNKGEPVIVQGTTSETWYRGLVIGVNKKLQTAEVELVDYGTVQECEAGHLRKHLMFTEIPLQRFKAKLDCLPLKKTWDLYSIDFLWQNLKEGPNVMANVIQNDCGVKKSAGKKSAKGVKKEECPLVVSVTLASKKDAADLLVNNGLARSMEY